MVESGHGLSAIGTKDNGAVGSGKTEREMTVILGRKVLEILRSKEELKNVLLQGVGVETQANLKAKIKFVDQVVKENRYLPGEALCLSIHMNAAAAKTATGFEVWYQTVHRPNKLALAESMVRAWDKYKITPLRKTPMLPTSKNRWGRLYIDDFDCIGVLAEVSFISNQSDVKAITQDYDRAAEALAHGIMEFFRIDNLPA